MKLFTDPNLKPVTFLAGCLIPVFFLLFLVQPPLALAVALFIVYMVRRRCRIDRARTSAARAYRQATWGY